MTRLFLCLPFFVPLHFYNTTKTCSWIYQLLIFTTEDSRNSWTSSACNSGGSRSIWDRGLFELLSLVSVGQQDWEPRKIYSLFLTPRLVYRPPRKKLTLNTEDFCFDQDVQLTKQCNIYVKLFMILALQVKLKSSMVVMSLCSRSTTSPWWWNTDTPTTRSGDELLHS